MSKKKVGSDDVSHSDDRATEQLFRVAVSEPRSIINGHILAPGTVVELTAAEIANHRSNGLPLHDVADDDKREVYSVREPYVAKDEND